MSLLREAVDRSLDPGYAVAAQARRARAEAGVPEHGRKGRAAVSGGLALLLGLAVTVAVAQLRLPAPPEAREGLLRQIEARTSDANVAQARVEQLRAEVDAQQAQALGGSDLAERTERLGLLAASSPVTGPGLLVTMDDAVGARDDPGGNDPRDALGSTGGLVLDRDLQLVVNGLFAAGAEAVAVNGHRLTSLASIRVAGQAILVDYQPLSPPYSIEAVGDPQDVAAAFASSTAGRYLALIQREVGIRVSSSAQERLELRGGSTQALRYATTMPGATPTRTRELDS